MTFIYYTHITPFEPTFLFRKRNLLSATSHDFRCPYICKYSPNIWAIAEKKELFEVTGVGFMRHAHFFRGDSDRSKKEKYQYDPQRKEFTDFNERT